MKPYTAVAYLKQTLLLYFKLIKKYSYYHINYQLEKRKKHNSAYRALLLKFSIPF